MRVTFISNGYSTEISGGDVHANRLAHFLALEKSVDVSMILPENAFRDVLKKPVKALRYASLPFEKRCYSSNIFLLAVYAYRIAASSFFINKTQSDVVVCSSHLFHDTFPLAFQFRKPRRFCYVHHIIAQQKRSGLHGAVTRFLERISFQILKAKRVQIVTVSKRVRDQLVASHGFDESRVHASSNAIDASVIAGALPKIGREKYDLVFCGRLVRSKGIFDLLEIMIEMKKADEGIRCAVIGSGKDEMEFKSRIRDLGLSENVICLGYLEDTDKFSIFKSSKVFVLPSHEEGWGIVIAEALALRVPVVTYRLPDIVDVWGDAVTWADCFDTQAFANETRRILENHEEAEARISAGFEVAASMDWNSVLSKEAELILSDGGEESGREIRINDKVAQLKRAGKQKREKILVLGSYGRGNAGDDAFLLAATRLLGDFDICINASADSKLPESVERSVSKVSTDLGRDFFKKVRIFSDVKKVVYAGGDLWVELHESRFKRSSLWKMLTLNAICLIFGKKVFYMGCGAGNLKGFSLFLARSSARLARGVVLRDEESKLMLGLRDGKSAVLPDLAACLFGDGKLLGKSSGHDGGQESRAGKVFKIGVSMLYYIPEPEKNFQKMIDRMSSVFDYFGAWTSDEYPGGVEFVLLPFFKSETDKRDDGWVNDHFSGKRRVTLGKTNDVVGLVEIMRSLDLVIGFRLHANILGVLAGTPCIGVSYRPKVRKFFESSGLGDYCVEIDELDLLIPKILGIMDRYREVKSEVARSGAALVSEARSYEKFIDVNIK